MLVEEWTAFSRNLGFELVGIASAKPSEAFVHFRRWIDDGFHAGMDYLAKNLDVRADPRRLLPGAKSVLMLGVSFRTVLESDPIVRNRFFVKNAGDTIPVASYACGRDYHLWIRERLKRLSEWHHRRFPTGSCRGCVDTAPFWERQYAENAGLGVAGKNTMLIHPEYGTRFFLAAFLTTEPLEPTEPLRFDPCSGCQRCQDACPTGTLGEPYRLDARKCINYQTIECKANTLDSSFGCDICQNACPWNRETVVPGRISRQTLNESSFEKLTALYGETPLMRGIRRPKFEG